MKKIRVLVVDNDEMVQMTLTHYLNASQKIEIIGTASNGLEAINETGRLFPDIVIMDLQMPVMDGLEATRKIKQMNAPVIVIMLSNFSDPNSAQEAVDSGATCSISKGAPLDELVTAILESFQYTKKKSLLPGTPGNTNHPFLTLQ